MDRRTKERVVGALVLVAAAVIVIPPLLDGEGLESLPTAMPPPPPEIPADLPTEAAAARLRARAEAGSPVRGDAAGGEAAAGPQAWAVQVGSFTRRENAFALRDRLRGQGFAAFVEPFTRTDGVRAWRVRVGPEPTREEAEALKARLVEAVDGKAIVVAHEHGRGAGP